MSHFGSIKIILKDKRNSSPAYLPHIFQIYLIFDLTRRCAAQNITWCVLSAGLLQHLTWCVLSAGFLQNYKETTLSFFLTLFLINICNIMVLFSPNIIVSEA
jgi:hypothetical protein